MSETTEKFDQWCIVELFGHQRIGGKVSEQVIADQGFVRVDVPEVKDQVGFTRLFGTGAIYSITPVSEEIVRAFVAAHVPAPVQPYELKRLNYGLTEDDEEEK